MMRKHMTFHGVDYIVVPVELWDEAKKQAQALSEGDFSLSYEAINELHANMLAYEGSTEPVELTQP
jgi:hypothetical protein